MISNCDLHWWSTILVTILVSTRRFVPQSSQRTEFKSRIVYINPNYTLRVTPKIRPDNDNQILVAKDTEDILSDLSIHECFRDAFLKKVSSGMLSCVPNMVAAFYSTGFSEYPRSLYQLISADLPLSPKEDLGLIYVCN